MYWRTCGVPAVHRGRYGRIEDVFRLFPLYGQRAVDFFQYGVTDRFSRAKKQSRDPLSGRNDIMNSSFSSRLAIKLMRPLGRTPMLGTVTAVKTVNPDIALTFDDGPDPEWTPILLDLLKARDAKATFFVVGESCNKYRWIIQRAASEGHAVCNHGWSHASLPMLAMREQLQEIRKCADVLKGIGFRFLRPPYGHQSIRSRCSALLASHHVVGWSAHVEDWRRQPAEKIYQRLQGVLSPGAIILLHDGLTVGSGITPSPDLQFDRSDAFKALEMVFTEYGKQFNFITVPELMKRGRPKWENWYRWSKEAA